jgi:riboflavin kinase/FMN adenylyltransferase
MSTANAPHGLELGGGHGTVITVGTFDGVHRGHWQLLDVVRNAAARLGRPSVLVTFDPHPLAIVRPDSAPPMLSTPAEKIEVLAESGLDYVVFLRFDKRLAATPPERFVDDYLIARFGLRHLVIGYDHGFGRGRSGDVETLRDFARERGFGIDVVEAVHNDEHPISSTRIRRALLAGDVIAAAHGLGRPYSMRGTVVRGVGRGRRLGFPTANLQLPLPSKLVPMPGVYVARAWLGPGLGAETANGLLHIGPRPTFPGAGPTIELHLLDFDGDLYGRSIVVRLCDRIRDVLRFDSEAALVRAMESDRAVARERFRAGASACAVNSNGITLHG